MAGFYDDTAEMVQELLASEDNGGLGQGVVELRRTTVVPPENDWEEGTETTETWPLNAAVKRLHQRYEGGVAIVETGDMVTFAVPDVEPRLSDLIVIDGKARAIPNLTPVPPAGVVVAYKAWCKS